MKITKEDIAKLGAGELHMLWELATLEMGSRAFTLESTVRAQWVTGLPKMREALGVICRGVVDAATYTKQA